MVTTAATSEDDHIFTVHDEVKTKYLTEEQVHTFHHKVAQLLFIGAGEHQDIQTVVEFLTKPVKKTDEEYWGKLKRVLKYLKITRELKLTLRVDDIPVVKWWLDPSYAVHENCQGHTGDMMSLGKGEV